MDNDQWLKNIGAVTVHDDDDRYDGGPVSSGITGGAPAGRADDGAGALDRGDADRVADRGCSWLGRPAFPVSGCPNRWTSQTPRRSISTGRPPTTLCVHRVAFTPWWWRPLALRR